MDSQIGDVSKNRGGRPVGIRGVRALASRHSLECVKVLVDVVKNEQASDADRVHAAEVVLTYATIQPNGSRS